ncbi:MAG: hypothetical protein M1834_008504 [Cirrosporium novae-zelandiae]|nr:MAG: hypothetical protein M1834_008504 [Cirrosporium novae-zelandiae]
MEPQKLDMKHMKAKPPEVNLLDHLISLRDGSTSALEIANHRLRAAKKHPPSSAKQWLEEVTKELGHLRLEVSFYRRCFDLSQQFRDDVYQLAQKIEVAYYFEEKGMAAEIGYEYALALNDKVEWFADKQTRAEQQLFIKSDTCVVTALYVLLIIDVGDSQYSSIVWISFSINISLDIFSLQRESVMNFPEPYAAALDIYV